jgi:hypothetical protein
MQVRQIGSPRRAYALGLGALLLGANAWRRIGGAQ